VGYLSEKNIKDMGFGHVGKNTQLSEKASYYNCPQISIGDNVRIDDFCVLSAGVGGIYIGQHIHIATQSILIGSGKITLDDYSNISSRVSIYSSSDDYSGSSMTNPTIPPEFTSVLHADVHIGRHVIIGSGSVILPGVTLEEGVAIGALSLVNKNCESFWIYSGIPVKRKKERKQELLTTERKFISRRLNQTQ
jgi:acetyltransferase-like isoleucine patch superfamily enzyme